MALVVVLAEAVVGLVVGVIAEVPQRKLLVRTGHRTTGYTSPCTIVVRFIFRHGITEASYDIGDASASSCTCLIRSKQQEKTGYVEVAVGPPKKGRDLWTDRQRLRQRTRVRAGDMNGYRLQGWCGRSDGGRV